MTKGKRDGIIIAGGGLSGCLAALAMVEKRPDVPVLVVEEAETFGGNHLWSFFQSDVDPADRWLVAPLVAHSWPGHYVAFPGHSRKLKTPYHSIPSQRLDAHMRKALRPDQYRMGTRIAAVRDTEIVMIDGEVIKADGVVDARGAANLSTLDLGWQKFVGRDYRFERPHGLDQPVVMDATVEQLDGYRFVYCLPFDDHRMLIEDTYYADAPALDVGVIGERLDAYVAARGWGPGEVEREEQGVLPVALGGDIDAFLRIGGARVGRLGLRGAFFHPTTGYSLPDAVRNAILLTRQDSFEGEALTEALWAESKRLWKQRGFYRTLDTMLFRAAEPAERYRILERFYRLPGDLVRRFYAGQSTMLDKARILTGRPPVPIGRAVKALRGR